jgi:serine/threonine protein kinase
VRAAQSGAVQSETLIGYRLIRLIGAGERAEVFLAVPAHEAGEPVALKVPLPDTTEPSVLVEAEALDRSRGDHVVALLDLASGPLGPPVLVLQRLAGPSLAHVLADRGSLSPGEAITVLVPVHGALTRAHDQGVAHGRVGADSVLFAEGGMPVLARFGAAQLGEPGRSEAALEADPAVAADRAAFRALAVLLLVDHVPDLDLTEWSDLPALLFSIAPAAPVALSGRAVEPPAPPRASGLQGAGVAVRAEIPASVPHPLVEPLLMRLPAPWRARADAALGSLSRVRRRTWILAAVALGALVTTLLMLPTSEPPVDPEPPLPAEIAPSPTPTSSVLTDDDPIAALVALLERRKRCLAERSILCLDAVGQPGSAALADDQALVQALQQGAELPEPFTVAVTDLVLEERLGDSALIAIIEPGDSEPASVLLMKGEAGWLIRGYLR